MSAALNAELELWNELRYYLMYKVLDLGANSLGEPAWREFFSSRKNVAQLINTKKANLYFWYSFLGNFESEAND